MTVAAVVREDEVGRDLFLQLLEVIFDHGAVVWEIAVPESLHDHGLSSCRRQEHARGSAGFAFPLLVRAEDHPGDRHVGRGFCQLQDRATAPDLDIVAVRPQTEDPPLGLRGLAQFELQHRYAALRPLAPTMPGDEQPLEWRAEEILTLVHVVEDVPTKDEEAAVDPDVVGPAAVFDGFDFAGLAQRDEVAAQVRLDAEEAHRLVLASKMFDLAVER